jgi:hypothetical protein
MKPSTKRVSTKLIRIDKKAFYFDYGNQMTILMIRTSILCTSKKLMLERY